MELQGRPHEPGALVPLAQVQGERAGTAPHRDVFAEVQRPDAKALEPLRKALNDHSLTQADRAKLVKDYFHHTIRAGASEPLVLSLVGHTDMPLSKSGGIDSPLLDELRAEPAFQKALQVAATEISQQKPIEQSWAALVPRLGVRDTLRSLAMIYSFYKWQDATGLPGGLKDAARDAYVKTCWVNQQRSADVLKGDPAAIAATNLPQTLVMNHGSSDVYDNPTHFFAHAWLAYRLRELGFSEKQALETSAFAGAYYEAERPDSLKENHGNDSIKDILMNSQGSDFGVVLFRDPHTPLPGAYDGIPAEDRSI